MHGVDLVVTIASSQKVAHRNVAKNNMFTAQGAICRLEDRLVCKNISVAWVIGDVKIYQK